MSHVPPAPAPTITSTTADTLGTFRAELFTAGVPTPTADALVEAAGLQLLHTHGLTVRVPGLGGTPLFQTLAQPPQARPKTYRADQPAGAVTMHLNFSDTDNSMRDWIRRMVRRAE